MFHSLKRYLVYLPLLLVSLLTTNLIFTAQTQQELSLQNNPTLLAQETPAKLTHKSYRNIIFDLGNVLLEWNPLKIAAHVHIQLDDIRIDDNYILHLMNSDAWKNLPWMKLETNTIGIEEFKTLLASPLDQKVLNMFLELKPHSLAPLENGIEIFKAVKARGYHVYILSNIPQDCLAVVHQHNDFFKLADGEIFSCNEHVAKPDAAIYHILLQRYNLRPEECLFIDDMQENINAGKEVGIDGIVYSSSAFVKNELQRLGVLE